MLKLFSFLLLFLSFTVQARYLDLSSAPEAQERVKLKKSNFNIEIQYNHKIPKTKLLVKIVKDSIKWHRYKTLTLPKLRVMVLLKDQHKEEYFLNYKDRNHTFQDHKNLSYTELFYSAFEKEKIRLYKNDKLIATVSIIPKSMKPNVLIDYTCSRNNIKVDIPKEDIISVGCETIRIGKIGSEKPLLKVHWISPTLTTAKQDTALNRSVFITTKSNHLKLFRVKDKKPVTIHISARIPKRLHRMFTAYGFGPSYFETEIVNNEANTVTKEKKKDTSPVSPSLYFYLNYKISDTASIRGFDAATFSKSKFNNAGLYLGNDFGFALDNRLYFSTLLGVQYLYFQFDSNSKEVSEPIFPQGIEFMYRHLFDIPNYIVSGGFFLSTSQDVDYQNIWVRWGKNYFWELNYINWGNDDFNAKMFGLSVGIPFMGLL